jgi:WD40 repeat protein
VRVWDLPSAKLEHVVENHADWVLGVAFSRDNKLLVTASRDKTAKIWDLAAKESVLTFPDHQNPVFGAGLSADGTTGFSAGEDGNLRQWQATDAKKQIGKQIRAVPAGKAVLRLAYRADPKNPLLIAGSSDGSVRLFDAGSGAVIKVLSGLADYVFAVAVSPDGQLVAGGNNSGEVRVWKTGDGSLMKSFVASPGHTVKTSVQ